MAYQEKTKELKKYNLFLKIKGEELIGAKIILPLGSHDLMYYLNKIAEDMEKQILWFVWIQDALFIIHYGLYIIMRYIKSRINC